MDKNFTFQLYKALGFVLKRQKEHGGFGATPKLPATLEDTYHALRIIELIQTYCGLPKGVALNDKKHSYFLKMFLQRNPHLSIKGIYQLVWCLNALNLKNEIHHVVRERIHDIQYTSNEEAYYILKTSRLVDNENFDFEINEENIVKTVTFQGVLEKRWMYVYVNVFTGNAFDKKYVAHWIKKCQNYDGGFGFLPGTTSYLENCHFAMRALTLIEEHPYDVFGAIEFVTGCQRKSGGFSRKADAAPFLDSTYHGVSALVLLDGIQKDTITVKNHLKLSA